MIATNNCEQHTKSRARFDIFFLFVLQHNFLLLVY